MSSSQQQPLIAPINQYNLNDEMIKKKRGNKVIFVPDPIIIKEQKDYDNTVQQQQQDVDVDDVQSQPVESETQEYLEHLEDHGESDSEENEEKLKEKQEQEQQIHMRRSMSHMGRFMFITEVPTNKMISTGVLLFEHDPNRMNQDIFKKLLYERVVCRFSRFKSVVNEETNEFELLDDDSFNMDNHFHSESIGYIPKKKYSHAKNAQLEENALRRLTSSIITRPLNRQLPLWDVITIDDYSKGFLVMWRIHHCIGDGTSLAMIVCEMADNPNVPEQFESMKQKYRPKETNHWIWSQKIIRFIHSIILILLFILGCIRILIKWTIMVWQGPDPITIFKGELTESKVVGFKNKKIKLEQVKQVGKVFHTTVNDVLMSCFAGALDRYSRKSGKNGVKKEMVRLSIPVNIRTNLNEMMTPSNKFGFIVCRLPLGVNDTLARLKQIKKEMDYNKKLPEQVFSYYVGLVTGYVLPKHVVKNTFNLLSSYQTAVMTNIRGPTEQISMNGVKVVDMWAFAPQPGGVSVGSLILSYNGYLNITVVGDQNLLPDAHIIARYMVEEFNLLFQIVKAKTLEKCE